MSPRPRKLPSVVHAFALCLQGRAKKYRATAIYYQYSRETERSENKIKKHFYRTLVFSAFSLHAQYFPFFLFSNFGNLIEIRTFNVDIFRFECCVTNFRRTKFCPALKSAISCHFCMKNSQWKLKYVPIFYCFYYAVIFFPFIQSFHASSILLSFPILRSHSLSQAFFFSVPVLAFRSYT